MATSSRAMCCSRSAAEYAGQCFQLLLLLCAAGCSSDTPPVAPRDAAVAVRPDSQVLVDSSIIDQEPTDVGVQGDLLPILPGCTRSDGCSEPATCNLVSGLCEARSTGGGGWSIKLHSVFPTRAAPGDTVVVDGEALYALDEDYTVDPELRIGDRVIPIRRSDDTRLVFTLPADAAGTLTLRGGEQDEEVQWGEDMLADAGLASRTCDGTTRPAAEREGTTPAEIGPFAVGFADSAAFDSASRIYYPATCGGVRTPVAEGVFPLVMVLHGDGALEWNYEYLGRHLASWGYIAVMPTSDDAATLARIFGVALDDPAKIFAPLAGKVLAARGALVGHSKGSERAEALILDQALGPRVGGVVYLGPVNQHRLLGVPLMVIGAGQDAQAPALNVRALYQVQARPKFFALIDGGNHSQFTDHKFWGAPFLDGVAQISRNAQFALVQSYALAFLQRIFAAGLQPFEALLEGSQRPAGVTFEGES